MHKQSRVLLVVSFIICIWAILCSFGAATFGESSPNSSHLLLSFPFPGLICILSFCLPLFSHLSLTCSHSHSFNSESIILSTIRKSKRRIAPISTPFPHQMSESSFFLHRHRPLSAPSAHTQMLESSFFQCFPNTLFTIRRLISLS